MLIPHLLIQQEPNKSPRDDLPTMRFFHSLDPILINLIFEHTSIVSSTQDMRYHFRIELWMSLHGDQASFGVHALVLAAGRVG